MNQFRVGILDFTALSDNVRKGVSRMYPVPYKGGTRLLREAIKALGHIPVIYKVENAQLYFKGRKSEILYNNKQIKGCDVLIPRVTISNNIDLEISILKQFQMMNVPVINGYLPVTRAKNKLRTLQILTQNSIPVPTTLVVRKLDYLDDAIKKIDGYPVILKTPFGSLGKGVALVESRRSLYSALDIIWKTVDANIILIQEYVAEAAGSDYRAFVLGDRVVAAMKRTAKLGDFRSNLYLGGEGEKGQLTQEEENLAVRATQALGLQVSGVDILRSQKGPLIMEVNATPGLEGISNATGIDIPKELVKYAIGYARKKVKKLNR